MAVSKRLRFEIFRRDKHTCLYCGASAPEVKLTIDHVIPEALGGTDEPSNLVTACPDCNSGKSSIPAGADTVEAASESALRWSAAIKAAADVALGDLAARDAHRAAFDERWNQWTNQDQTLPRPSDWALSVDRFLAAGLPLPVLLDCVDTAMSTQRVAVGSTFRYMCGIAWSKVTDLQKTAREIADGGSTAPAARTQSEAPISLVEGRAHFARELLNEHLYDDERDAILNKKRDQAASPDSDLRTDNDVVIEAAYEAFGDVLEDRWRLTAAVYDLLELASPEAVETCLQIAQQEWREYVGDEEPREPNIRCGQARWLKMYVHFKALPELQQDEWTLCVATAHGVSVEAVDLRHVLEHAWKSAKGDAFVLHGMCVREGEHGANCTRRAVYEVTVADCAVCHRRDKGECVAHPMCAEHSTEMVDGEFVNSRTNEPVRVSDLKDLAGAA